MVEVGASSERGPPKTPTWPEIEAALLSTETPITDRYRALFHAKMTAPSLDAAVQLLVDSVVVQVSSILVRHELCYVLGQLADVGGGESSASQKAVALLQEILTDEKEDEIVRHEAAESLAALEITELIDVLDRVAVESKSEPLRHTCELAAAGLKKKAAKASVGESHDIPICTCQFTSRDPAEGRKDATEADAPDAGALLLDETKSLYERYEAMFTLRNVGGDAASEFLSRALHESSSACLRHEVAFVLGQMESEMATTALIDSLADATQHGMVRHEAAIALGTIGTDDAEKCLRQFLNDEDQLVAESCEVALATAAYWRAWEELEARLGSSGA